MRNRDALESCEEGVAWHVEVTAMASRTAYCWTRLGAGVLCLAACESGAPVDVGRVGPPAALTVVAGDGQIVPAGSPVPVLPEVRVADASGQGVEGVEVQFSIGGNSTIDQATAITTARGVAGPGMWRMGLAGEVTTLTATVETLPEASVTLRAASIGTLVDLYFLGTPYQTPPLGDLPYGVVAVDFDGDGYLDVATATCVTDNITLYRGEADGSLAPLTISSHYPAGRCPRWIVSGDLDGDGRIDLATVNLDGDNVSVFLGNGDGTMGPSTEFAVGSAPRFLAVGDLNGDGALDLVTANADGQSVSVLLGGGDGTFPTRWDVPVGGSPVEILVADLDGDDRQDLAVSVWKRSTGDPVVSVLLGNGDGTFQDRMDHPTDPRVGTYGDGFSLAAGDFDGDGVVDLVASNVDASSVSVLMGTGDGGFHPRFELPTLPRPMEVVVADFDDDGHLDVLVTTARIDGCVLCGGPMMLYGGNGDGTFWGPFDVGVGAWSTGIAAVDMNGDARLDLVVANGPDDLLYVLLQGSRH